MSFMEKRNKTDNGRYNTADWLIFALLLIGYAVLTFTLFYRQTLGNPGYYHSDMKAYILEMQGLESGYSFPYPLFFKLGAFFHLFINSPELSIAVAVTLLNSLSPVVMKWSMNRLLFKECGLENGREGIAGLSGNAALAGSGQKQGRKRLALGGLITVCVFVMLFVSMVFPPRGIYLPGIKNNYVGVFTPNPHHNATYNATRPFAIAVFFLFPVILDEYEKKINWKHNIIFAVFLLLTTMTKPSFTFVMVPTAGLIMLYRIFKSKFKNFIPSVQLGICFIPTFIALLYQFFGVFVPTGDEEGGIGFGFAEVWKERCDNIPLAIGLALGFPILVLIFNRKDLKKDTRYRFSWQMMLVSMAELLCMYEKGFRKHDMNFSWGYMHGLFFAFVGAMLVLIRRTWKREGNGWLTAAQWLACGWHLACGIYYFYGIFQGQLYY